MLSMKATKQVMDNVDFLLWVLNSTYENLENIKMRVAEEEKFIKTGEYEDFTKVLTLWQTELSLDKKILDQLNPANMSQLEKFFEKIKKLTKGKYFDKGAIASIFMGIMYANTKDEEFKMLLSFGLLAGIMLMAIDVIKNIWEMESVTFRQQQEALIKLKKK